MVRKYAGIAKLLAKLAVIVTIIVVGLRFAFSSGYFDVQEVSIFGTKQFVNAADIHQMADSNTLGHNLIKFNTADLEKKLENNFLGAKNVVVEKTYPDKLKIIIIERTPIAVIYQNQEENFLVDEDGYVLGFADPKAVDLPRLRYEKEIKVGLFIDKQIVPLYLELTELLDQEKIKVSSMSFNPNYVQFFLDKGVEVLVGNEKDKSEAIKAISALLQQSNVDDQEIQRIDLRYDKVIVLFN